MNSFLKKRKLTLFLIFIAAIFVLGRFQIFADWTSLLFPIFIILFILISKNLASDFKYAIAASIFFDFFSGFTFGRLTLAILAVYVVAYAIKKFVSVGSDTPVVLFVLSLLLACEYILLSSVRIIPLSFIFARLLGILAETSIISAIAILLFRKLNFANNDSF